MGGDITVESPPASGAEEKGGRGSVFSFDIQVEPADPAEVVIAKPMRRVVGLLPDQPTYRILVVEDNLQNRVLLSKLMQCVGFKVREADNGQEAIEEFEKWRPHLIWMDMRMPVMDGYEATKRIRELGTLNPEPGTVIVALTAHAFEEEREAILAAGCDDYIRKPIREVDIFDAMAKHLGVRYVYEESREQRAGSKEQYPEDILSPEALAGLPDDLLTSLNQAIIDLDVNLMLAVIERIRELSGPVADALRDLAMEFQYEKILVLLGR